MAELRSLTPAAQSVLSALKWQITSETEARKCLRRIGGIGEFRRYLKKVGLKWLDLPPGDPEPLLVTKTVTLKTTTNGINATTTMAHPGAKPGQKPDASLRIIEITNVPDHVPATSVILAFNACIDLTGMAGNPERFVFDIGEMKAGAILK